MDNNTTQQLNLNTMTISSISPPSLSNKIMYTPPEDFENRDTLTPNDMHSRYYYKFIPYFEKLGKDSMELNIYGVTKFKKVFQQYILNYMLECAGIKRYSYVNKVFSQVIYVLDACSVYVAFTLKDAPRICKIVTYTSISNNVEEYRIKLKKDDAIIRAIEKYSIRVEEESKRLMPLFIQKFNNLPQNNKSTKKMIRYIAAVT
jgi:hypothetical protein